MNYKVVTLEERYDLFREQDDIGYVAWPEFMHHDPVANKYWMEFINAYKKYQLILMAGDEIIALANTIPIHFDKPLKQLPEEG